MKNTIYSFLALILILGIPAQAGNVTTYPNVTAVSGSDLFFDWQGGAQQNCTATQLKVFLTGGGTLNIGTGKTLNSTGTVTFAGTDGSTVTYGGGGTVLYASNIGASVQAYNANLSTLASSNPFIAGSGISFSGSWPTIAIRAVSIMATTSGTNTYTATPSPALASYVSGMQVVIKFSNANTGGASLNLNGLGAVTIQQNGSGLAASQIPAGATLSLLYDGTYFQIIGNDSGGYSFSTGLTNTSGVITVNYGTSSTTALRGDTFSSSARSAGANAVDVTGGLLTFNTAASTYAPILTSDSSHVVLGDGSYADVTTLVTAPQLYAGSFSGTGTATTSFVVTLPVTQSNNYYTVNVTATNSLSAALFYISAKSTTTFTVTYASGLTGGVAFDWSIFPQP